MTSNREIKVEPAGGQSPDNFRRHKKEKKADRDWVYLVPSHNGQYIQWVHPLRSDSLHHNRVSLRAEASSLPEKMPVLSCV